MKTPLSRLAIISSLLWAQPGLALSPEILSAAQTPDEIETLTPGIDAYPLDPLQTQSLSQVPTRWDSIFGSPNVTFGVQINAPGATDPVAWSKNATSKFRPASNTKLFTTALALEKLGAEYRFETKITWLQDESDTAGTVIQLTLIGSGDPSWGLWDQRSGTYSEIRAIADALANAGIKKIEGPILTVAADARWDQVTYPEGWGAAEYSACYGALAQAFNLQINCATFKVTGLTSGAWVEEGVSMPVKVKLTRGAATALWASPELDESGVPASFVISGTLARGATSGALILPVVNTAEWVRNALVAELQRKGIVYDPEMQTETPPPPERLRQETLSFYSRPLGEILKPFMKSSINIIGDAFFKKVGESTSESSLWSGGKAVMAEFLPSAQVTNSILNDGCGISRVNWVTPQDVLSLLQYLRSRADFSWVWDSLPIAGVDGTLKARMKGTAAEGVLRAKTGTLSGVYAMSGFVPQVDASGAIIDYVPFSTLTETTSAFKTTARGAQDQAGAYLSSLLKSRL